MGSRIIFILNKVESLNLNKLSVGNLYGNYILRN
jgi:hypothetical protein